MLILPKKHLIFPGDDEYDRGICSMLASNHLIGFGVGDASLVETLISQGTGTNIGSMTGFDGLAGAFDGNTATLAGTANADTGYVGKSYSPAKIISKATAQGLGSGIGFFENRANATLTLYGKNGAPSSGTDGTSLATSGSFADASITVTLTVPSPVTAYTHVWVYFSGSGGGLGHMYTLEVNFYEMI